MIAKTLQSLFTKSIRNSAQFISLNNNVFASFSTQSENYYRMLGVNKNSTPEEIKKAYYSLAQKMHPDVSQEKNAGENFAKINNAYQILSDQQKRRDYDRSQSFDVNDGDLFGQFKRQSQYSTSSAYAESDKYNQAGGKSNFNFEDFFSFDEELLKDFLNSKQGGNKFRQNNKAKQETKSTSSSQQKSGSQKYVYDEQEFDFVEDDDFMSEFGKNKKGTQQGFSKDKRKKGTDVTQSVSISFEESINGCTKVVEVEKKSLCEKCNGSKRAPGSKKKLCKTCKGTGNVQFQQGLYVWEFRCEDCNGAGQLMDCPCKHCRASGITTQTVKETVHIPKGVNHGQTIKFPNQGNHSEKGGAPGDLVLKLKVTQDKEFKKTGYDIFSDHTISPARAILGGKITVKTMKGDVEVTIPAGIQDGHKLKILGYGVNRENDRELQGDQFVTLNVKIPRRLSTEEKILYEQLLQLEQ